MNNSLMVFFALNYIFGLFSSFIDTPVNKTIVPLGGPRKVSVEIIKNKSTYLLTATFVPVKSFDKALNISLSRDKADSYIREALFKYLGGKSGDAIEISHMKRLKSEISGESFTYLVEISAECIKLQPAKKQGFKEITKKEMAIPKSILNAKNDEIATLDFILKANESDYPKFNKDLEDFYKQVAESEITILDRFEAFNKALLADKWLLSIERNELIQKSNTEKSKTIERLQALVQEAEFRAAKQPD